MLSGIGPADHLNTLKIPVLLDLPGVGSNLQDRYEITVVSEFKQPWKNSVDLTKWQTANTPAAAAVDIWQTLDHSGSHTGQLTSDGVATAFLVKSQPTLPDPDLYIFGLLAQFLGYAPYWFSSNAQYANCFTWSILKAHTTPTAGTVRLQSINPTVPPNINFRYFNDTPDANNPSPDLQALVFAVKFARSLMANLPAELGCTETHPGPDYSTDQQIAQYCIDNCWGHHCSCTCRMGPKGDPNAVVNSKFQVFGTTNLRVVDASVFIKIPGYFIAVPIYMISEKASQDILSTSQFAGLQGSRFC
jgi:choline dehydrogenase